MSQEQRKPFRLPRGFISNYEYRLLQVKVTKRPYLPLNPLLPPLPKKEATEEIDVPRLIEEITVFLKSDRP